VYCVTVAGAQSYTYAAEREAGPLLIAAEQAPCHLHKIRPLFLQAMHCKPSMSQSSRAFAVDLPNADSSVEHPSAMHLYVREKHFNSPLLPRSKTHDSKLHGKLKKRCVIRHSFIDSILTIKLESTSPVLHSYGRMAEDRREVAQYG
jgi:hypothetical protein